MPTVKLVEENSDHPVVRRVFADIKATKKIDCVPTIWRALATNPEHLELCWTRLKAIMQPGKLDMLTKEIIALAVSVTNSCRYCINSHTAAVQKLGLDDEALGEVLAVVGLLQPDEQTVRRLSGRAGHPAEGRDAPTSRERERTHPVQSPRSRSRLVESPLQFGTFPATGTPSRGGVGGTSPRRRPQLDLQRRGRRNLLRLLPARSRR